MDEPSADDAVQESLFGELTTGGDGVDAPPRSLRTGPGRPKGSVNKRTRQYADLIVSQYGSPLQRMAQVYSADLDELRGELGCSKADALALQLQAARDAAPYVHEKRPQAHQVQGQVAALVIHRGLPGGDGAGSDRYAMGQPVDAEFNEINDLPGADAGQSDAGQSDAGSK